MRKRFVYAQGLAQAKTERKKERTVSYARGVLKLLYVQKKTNKKANLRLGGKSRSVLCGGVWRGGRLVFDDGLGVELGEHEGEHWMGGGEVLSGHGTQVLDESAGNVGRQEAEVDLGNGIGGGVELGLGAGDGSGKGGLESR